MRSTSSVVSMGARFARSDSVSASVSERQKTKNGLASAFHPSLVFTAFPSLFFAHTITPRLILHAKAGGHALNGKFLGVPQERRPGLIARRRHRHEPDVAVVDDRVDLAPRAH